MFPIVLSCLFFITMITLTVIAPEVHKAMLPHVRVQKLTKEPFPYKYTFINGIARTSMHQRLAINEKYFNEQVFLLFESEKNGTQRYFVHEASIKLGAYNNGYYELISGLIASDRIVTDTDKKLFDGSEVFIDKE